MRQARLSEEKWDAFRREAKQRLRLEVVRTYFGLALAAVIVGSAVMLFAPIFQGLANSLMTGEVASLMPSRMTVPILYYLGERRKGPLPALQGASHDRQ